jgi:hypothetical protein
VHEMAAVLLLIDNQPAVFLLVSKQPISFHSLISIWYVLLIFFEIDFNVRLQWKSGSWQQQITDDKYVGETGIHSVQNGILLEAGAHAFFDKYMIAINPDVRLIISIRSP